MTREGIAVTTYGSGGRLPAGPAVIAGLLARVGGSRRARAALHSGLIAATVLLFLLSSGAPVRQLVSTHSRGRGVFGPIVWLPVYGDPYNT